MRGRGSSFDPHDTKSIPRTTSDWQTKLMAKFKADLGSDF